MVAPTPVTTPKPASTVARRILLVLLGVGFIGAGLNHFFHHAFYKKMMPDYLPWHAELVCISGMIEILLGCTVLVPSLRRWSGYGLILLLIAVFPANLNMAINADRFADMAPVALWLRLPIQLVLIYWVYWVAVQRPAKAALPARAP